MRGAYRGNGFELASDAWNTLRAKRGMFLSTAQRIGARSTQLDAQEVQEKLNSAAELAGALSEAAAQQQAMPISTLNNMRCLAKTIIATGSTGGRRVPAFEHPVALLDSQASINSATPASSLMSAGQDMTLTAALALRMSAAQTASIAVAKAASLFTHAGGAKVIAAKEAVSVRAHTGPMDVLADWALVVTSSNGSIKVQAKQEILLASGGGYIKLTGSNVDIHCPASLTVKGGTHDFMGAERNYYSFTSLPSSTVAQSMEERFRLVNRETGEPIRNLTYFLELNNGAFFHGKTNQEGYTQVASSEVPINARCYWGKEARIRIGKIR